jgi:hypothetical protein
MRLTTIEEPRIRRQTERRFIKAIEFLVHAMS